MIIGRLLLEFLGMQETIAGRRIETSKLSRRKYDGLTDQYRRDLRVTDAGGIQISREVLAVDIDDWKVLTAYWDIASRMTHLTWPCAENRELIPIDWSKHEKSTDVTRAIPLVVLAVKRCFYDRLDKCEIPVPKNYLEKYGIS